MEGMSRDLKELLFDVIHGDEIEEEKENKKMQEIEKDLETEYGRKAKEDIGFLLQTVYKYKAKANRVNEEYW